MDMEIKDIKFPCNNTHILQIIQGKKFHGWKSYFLFTGKLLWLIDSIDFSE